MAELQDVNPGDVITSQRQNDITDYIHDGTHEINTQFIRVGSTITIDSNRNITTTGSIITTGSVNGVAGSFTGNMKINNINTGSLINLTSSGVAFFASDGTTKIAILDDNGNLGILGMVYQL